MFHHIKGILTYKGANYAVIEACGAGYKVFSSLNSIEAFGDIGCNVEVLTHFRVGDGICELYGFKTSEELKTFEILIGITGVGHKLALAILSKMNTQTLALSVITNDITKIKQVNGVGNKLAQRIMLELKDKFNDTSAVVNVNLNTDCQQQHNVAADAIGALVSLGYSAKEAQQALALVDKNLSLEETIKSALRHIAVEF